MQKLSSDQFKLTFLIFTFFLFGKNAFSSTSEYLSILNHSRTLNEPIELHLTSDNEPLQSGIEVSLDHEDAWLFFDNIKPSLVIRDFLDQVKINGSKFLDGQNGRVSVYAHGTVLIPHSTSFKPLIVYTNESFQGSSKSYGIHTYHNSLGDFENEIRSFKLKKGYQVTFATKNDGQGYSRVFIADKEDLEFETMPDFLDGSISFIRIFKHQWVTKKGWAGWNWDEYQMTNSTWYYDWSAGGSSTSNLEYAVIKQNSGWPGWSEINNKQNVSHLLGFNEPDRPDQADMKFEDALAMWPQYMSSGLRLGSPATADPFNGWSLFNFIDRCDELNYRVDFVAIHAYWAKSPQQWYNDLKYIHDKTGRPIWITEWNNGANWTNEWWPDDPTQYTTANAEKQLRDLKAILNVLDTTSFVERYSIYNWVEDARAVVLNGELTLAGEYYANNKSKIAYNSKNNVIPNYSYKSPVLSHRYLTLSNSIRLSWKDDNGDLTQSYKIEKKVNGGSYIEIFSSDDLSDFSYLDPIVVDASGAVRYRVGIETANGNFVYSNEISYFQTGGSTDIQVGVFPVNSSDWVQTIFAKKYSSSPKVLLGVPTFKNAVPITTRVNSINTTSFMFKSEPWKYINNAQFSSEDQLSVLAIPAGVYDFGGLQGEVGKVSGVTKEWVQVNFETAFETVPVVFCTQVSNGNAFPTTVAVDNITTTSFDVRLKSEEAITANALAEKINFLAIESGTGAIDNYRVTVGQTGSTGAVGNESIKISYDESYAFPAIFGGLLTEANEFASTLRYYESAANEFTLFKQREMSGKLAPVKKGQVGWMIIDFDSDQTVSVQSTTINSAVYFYPNPVQDFIYFNFADIQRVEIFSLSGVKLMERKIHHSLDVSTLSSGVYFIKTDNHTFRFIKR